MKLIDPRAPLAAFQPPSDMVSSGGGSSTTKKVFVGLGIGCGVVLIILGILFAAGAFKAVTCCNQVKGIAQTSMAAENFANQFADEIWTGKLDEAYGQTSTSFQSSMDAEAFKAAVEAHRDRMKSNQPRMFNMQLEQSGAEKPSLDELAKGTWMMSYQFAGPQDETMLLLNFRVAQAPEGSTTAFEVADVKFDERPRNLPSEPPAAEVLEVHDMLQRGQYELAYARLGDGFRTSTDRDAWRKFLDDAGAPLTSSTLEIREVSYNDANTQATVMAHAKTTDGRSTLIQFELQPMQQQMPGFGWRIVSIAPLIAETPKDAPTEAPQTNGSGATNGGATNGGAATNGARAPTVDAQVEGKK